MRQLSADIVLMTDEPSKLITAIKVAKNQKNCMAKHNFRFWCKACCFSSWCWWNSFNVGSGFADVGVAL